MSRPTELIFYACFAQATQATKVRAIEKELKLSQMRTKQLQEEVEKLKNQLNDVSSPFFTA